MPVVCSLSPPNKSQHPSIRYSNDRGFAVVATREKVEKSKAFESVGDTSNTAPRLGHGHCTTLTLTMPTLRRCDHFETKREYTLGRVLASFSALPCALGARVGKHFESFVSRLSFFFVVLVFCRCLPRTCFWVAEPTNRFGLSTFG